MDPAVRLPTSVVLEKLAAGAHEQHVSLGWLIANLGERSFGIVMLVLGLVALVPGASGLVGVLLMIPAFQMMMARKGPVFPRFLARRPIATRRLTRLIARINPSLRRMERIIRPRWTTPFEATKRVIGFVLLSFAYLEEDGIALCIALVAALATLAVTAATVWATVLGVDFVGRL